MRKIPSLFMRADGEKNVSNIVNPDAEWVTCGEGWATVKRDGTACLIRDGKLYKRCEWSESAGPAPARWLHHSFNPEQRSGHGWMPVGDGPEDRWHREANINGLPDGTYELVGPRVQKNPENREMHMLLRHGAEHVGVDFPRDFASIRARFEAGFPYEGVVWHHTDGRMAKVKVRDFGLHRSRSTVSA